MLSKVILGVGCNDKDLHKQVMKTEEIVDIITTSMASVGIVGATITTGAVGIYNGEIEKSISVVLYEVEYSAIEELCDLLKMALNQECIAVEIVENVNVKFM